MFGLFKKKQTVSEQNAAAIEKLKTLIDRELVSRDCLKKMGIKSLLTEDPKITGKMSHRDACECLLVIKKASFKLLDFSTRINEEASKVNDEILAAEKAAIFSGRPKATSHEFYTIKNIMAVFRNTPNDPKWDELSPGELEDPFSPLSVYLKMYGSSLNIAASGISYAIAFVGFAIR